MQLDQRRILITGASQGLGKAIAEACLRAGASVAMCARDSGLLEKTRGELESSVQPGRRIVARAADVVRESDVRHLFETAVTELGGLDGVVNNAGVYGPKGLLQDVDIEEWWSAIQTNLLGVMLSCREALRIFAGQGHGKIVNLSGGGATSPLPRISAYAASKAAVVRLTETIAVEAGEGIDVNAIAPGALNTRMLEEVLRAGPARVGEAFYQKAVQQKSKGGAPLSAGAELCVFLLSSASDGITGRLISAVWDPWKDLASRAEELRKSDIYTLRRIVPGDRGLSWD